MIRKLVTTRLWILIVVLAVLFTLPLFVKTPYVIDLMTWVFLFGLFATCVYQVATVNRLLFGAAAFIGIGAYASSLLTLDVGMPFWPAMLLAGVFAAVVAFVIGLPLLKVSGVYFAIVTWVLSEIFVAFYKEIPIFRGVLGVRFIPAPTIMGEPFVGKTPYYYLALGIIIVSLLFFYRLRNSRFGHDLKVIGNSEDLASALGINVPRYRLMCFVIACFFLGIGGSFYAHYSTYIDPRLFSIDLSSQVFAFIVVGGINSVWGGIVGSALMTLIPEGMHALGSMKAVIYGAAIVLVMVFIPDGVLSIPRQIRLWRSRRQPSSEGAAYPMKQ